MSNTAYQWTPIIILHTLAATSAVGVGAALLLKRKGTFNHRLFGWIWVLLMASVALLSFGIQRNGFSWIHLLSIFTLVMLIVGVRNARKHKVMQHGKTMKGIYLGALVITGLFTLLPTRLIGNAIFG
ncbi:MAG: hypothetical protein EBU74_04085 [Betaproteobacteria bacterium]|jgi:uncharacterized membrane protein|nr:hypothetical protein [Betaproteobacteria bacterium]